MANNGRWLVVADGRRAKLIYGSRTEQGSPHLELKEEIEFDQTQYAHEHGRPSMLKGRSEHTHAFDHDEKERFMELFAKQLADWLTRRLEEIDAPGVSLFAPPKFLGYLRKELPREAADRLAEFKADLTSVPLGELGRHPLVAEQL